MSNYPEQANYDLQDYPREEVAEIDRRISSLRGAVEELELTEDEMAKRLSPVLRPALGPDSVNDQCNPIPNSSPMALDIERITDRIRTVVGGLRDDLDRLEV